MREHREPKNEKSEREEFKPERGRIIEKEIKKGIEPEKTPTEKAIEITKKIIETGKKKELKPKITEKKTSEEIEKARKIIEGILKKKEAGPGKKEEKEIGRGKIETRKAAIKEVLGLSKEIRDLVGIDSPGAWRKRKQLLETKNPRIIKEILGTLAGLPDSPEALKLLSNYLGEGEKQPYWRAIAMGLIGKTSKRAEEMRNFLEFAEPETKKKRGGNWLKWINRLGLQKSEGFFKLRKEIDKRVGIGWFLPSDVVLSDMGSNTPEANKRRTAYKNIAPVEALMSTAGIKPGESAEVDAIRQKFAMDSRLRRAYDLAVKGNNY